MKLGALVGWGIAIYAVVFLAWSLLVIHGYVEGMLPRLFLALTLVVIATIAGRALRFRHWYDVLPYSIGWALMAALFDLLCAVPVSGLAIYSDWNIWVGYSLLITIPLLAPLTRTHHERARVF